MFKNLKIGTKITILVVAMVLLTMVVASIQSYNWSIKNLEIQYDENLNVQAESRVNQIDAHLEDIRTNANKIINSSYVKAYGSGQMSSDMTFSDDAAGMTFSDDASDATFSDDTELVDDQASFESSGAEDMELADDMELVDDMGSGDAGGDDMSFSSDFGGMDMGGESSGGDNGLQTYFKDVRAMLDFESIEFIDAQDGNVLVSTTSSAGSRFKGPDDFIAKVLKDGTYFSEILKIEESFYFLFGTASQEGDKILAVKVVVNSMKNIWSDTTGLGQTGEIVIGAYDKSNDVILFINDLRMKKSERNYVKREDAEGLPIQLAIDGESGSRLSTDYRKKETLASWRNIASTNWGLVAKIDKEELEGEARALIFNYSLSGLVIAVIATILALVFAFLFVKPIHQLKLSMEEIGRGILPSKVHNSGRDEIGMMAITVNNLVQGLRRTASFANKIGEGDFDADFEPMSNNDTLGQALVAMRDNLIEAEKRDKQRNWIVTGVAEIGDILRAHDTLNTLGDDVVKFIINKIGAVQGAFYVVNEDAEDEESVIELTSSFAYNRKKYLEAKFKFAQGLVGQSAIEQSTILRTEIPEDYVSITSGLIGDKKPTCLLIVPLITNEEVFGVLEFAGFNLFGETEVKFVEELSLSLARTVFNIKVNERTRKLLEESQEMSNELTEKQEVLRQNAEEMQATQEELRRSNSRLEEQINEVNNTQKRMQLLLENASEVITIYEENETIRYISPSVEPILGYTMEELIGSKDIDNVLPEYIELVQDMFAKLIENPYEQVTIQYEYKTKSGESIWIESTGTNFLSNPAIQGIIVNSQDITERRRAELEQRMRSKMQALSENSPDLITRLEKDGPISYINPIIESYTGKDASNYLNHPMKETDFNDQVVDSWASILDQIKESNDKVAMEMDFPSIMGDRVMQVNAIPEFDDDNALESILLVSHDITERKVIELEIQNKNKKINDSINYAKRIQGAILPNTNVINRTLPQSFILYKPKDVVSGDFPWYIQTDEFVYIAAVDCTGHGVPGALLSLIGYFLLNDIVKSRKITDPGQILDQLDEGVTKTLRQDQDDSKTKDGMDIGLCKIHLESNTVEYAGAHRPLYMMKDNEMVEIKGNKFAIGGGIYKNQTNFTNHTIKLKKNDSIYFCSDGFPDQFGGPDNRKFGPKRTRALVEQVKDLSMGEAYEIFNTEWENWKGEQKQTDDVLLIGIKF